MTWQRSTEELASAAKSHQSILLLVPRSRMDELQAVFPIEVIDAIGDERSPAEHAPRRDFSLVRLGHIGAPAMSTRSFRWRLTWLFLLLATLLVLFTNLGNYRPLTTHEVYVGQTAREMHRTGSWLNPVFLGEPRWQKPPLAYWQVMLLSTLAGGSSAWLTRAAIRGRRP